MKGITTCLETLSLYQAALTFPVSKNTHTNVFSSGRIFVLHVKGLSELEGIEFLSSTGKLSPETFDNVSET